jgi:hypothetical protein
MAAGVTLRLASFQNPLRSNGDLAPPSYRKRFIIMPVCQKQHLPRCHRTLRHDLYHCPKVVPALQLLSLKGSARYLSAFISELFHGYSGNKSKTHSDLEELRQNLLRHKNAPPKKNKPISGDLTKSLQSILRQQIRRKKVGPKV